MRRSLAIFLSIIFFTFSNWLPNYMVVEFPNRNFSSAMSCYKTPGPMPTCFRCQKDAIIVTQSVMSTCLTLPNPQSVAICRVIGA
jgi:hypothetical protein